MTTLKHFFLSIRPIIGTSLFQITPFESSCVEIDEVVLLGGGGGVWKKNVDKESYENHKPHVYAERPLADGFQQNSADLKISPI